MLSPIIVVIVSLMSAIHGHRTISTTKSAVSNTSLSIYLGLPPDIHRTFNVSIHFPLFHTVKSALLVYLVNRTRSTSHNLLDKFQFDPGSKPRLTETFKGVFMTVLLCISYSNEKSIELHIKFKKEAQNQNLLIYYSQEYVPSLNKTTASLIKEWVISCNVTSSPNITLLIGRHGVDEQAFMRDQIIWINCSAVAEHEPFWRTVTLEGLDNFDILKQEVANVTRASSIYTTATIKNHGRIIICRSLDHSVSRKILIYHHPVSVTTTPSINSWSKIPYNVSIRCNAVGGYPPPLTGWQMRIGPHNASLYFKYEDGFAILNMRHSAPPGSKWIFECSAKNSIPHSNDKGPFLTISFNVPELTIESRKVVLIAVPIVVIFVILAISLLKKYCLKSKPKEKVPLFIFTFEQSIGCEEGRKSDKTISDDDISKEDSSTTYSIEAGITNQFLFVLDHTRNWDTDENVESSSAVNWLRPNCVEDVESCHSL